MGGGRGARGRFRAGGHDRGRSRGSSPPPASTTATGTATATTAAVPAASSARRRRRGAAGAAGGGWSGSRVVAGGVGTAGGAPRRRASRPRGPARARSGLGRSGRAARGPASGRPPWAGAGSAAGESAPGRSARRPARTAPVGRPGDRRRARRRRPSPTRRSSGGSESPSRRASRRQRGPTASSRSSSNSSQAARADCGRCAGSFASRRVDPTGDRARDARRAVGERRRLVAAVREQDRERLAGAERHRSRQQLVRDHADRVEVRPGADLLRHRLLGRHVGGGPDRDAGRGPEHRHVAVGQRPGDAEVGDLHAPFGGDQQVLGLQVAVDDARRVRVREPGEHALEHAAELGRPEPAHPRAQRAARHVLHGDVTHPVVLEDVEHGDDALVVERAGQPRLADEPADHLGVLALELEQLLQRHEPVELDLPGQVHASHPAPAQLPHDLVPPDLHARILRARAAEVNSRAVITRVRRRSRGVAASSPAAGSGRCSRSGSAGGSPGARARPPRTGPPR